MQRKRKKRKVGTERKSGRSNKFELCSIWLGVTSNFLEVQPSKSLAECIMGTMLSIMPWMSNTGDTTCLIMRWFMNRLPNVMVDSFWPRYCLATSDTEVNALIKITPATGNFEARKSAGPLPIDRPIKTIRENLTPRSTTRYLRATSAAR
jgi:hypothetical protein